MLYTSYGNGYRLTHNEEYKKALLRAADLLATLKLKDGKSIYRNL